RDRPRSPRGLPPAGSRWTTSCRSGRSRAARLRRGYRPRSRGSPGALATSSALSPCAPRLGGFHLLRRLGELLGAQRYGVAADTDDARIRAQRLGELWQARIVGGEEALDLDQVLRRPAQFLEGLDEDRRQAGIVQRIAHGAAADRLAGF